MFFSPASRLVRLSAALIFIGLYCTSVCRAETQEPEIDPAADKRLKAMSKYYGDLESFSVEAVHETEMQRKGEEGQSHSDQRRIVFERPNLLAVTASGSSEGKVICNGQQLLAYLPSVSRYLLVDAPETIAEMMQQEAAFVLGAGRTVVQLAAGDSYDQFMESASTVLLLEPEQVEKVECDRIEMTQENAKTILWIEQGDRPRLRKMQSEMPLDVPGVDFGVISQVVTFSNWEVDQPIADETFAIEVPEDAEQVATFMTRDRPDEGPHPLLGAQAPDCELPLLEGGQQKLAEMEGKKVIVLDFWALWCGPCLEALPSIDKVATKFADRDVAFFAVNLGDEPKAIRNFLEQHELKLPIAIDAKSELSDLFQADSIPMTVIVDKQGVVQVVHVGFGSSLEKMLSEEIEAVLEGQQLAEETLQAAREASRWGEPIPAGVDAVTAKDVVDNLVAFNLLTTVNAYKEYGSRDAAWDEAAIEFLTEAARHFSSAPGCKMQMELVEMAEPLVESDCDDPLVQYCHGAMLQDAQQDKDSMARGSKLVEKSYTGLVDRGYPANRCFAAAQRIWNNSKQEKDLAEKAEKYFELAQEHALATILQDDLQNQNGRTVYSHVYEFLALLPLESQKEFCKKAKAYDADSPYVVNMLVGDYHFSVAWKARGGGWASEVSEEGWKDFGEHIELSREAFEKAWEAAPNRPEAATAMISVAMASSPTAYREMRLWFDRAVQAQFDYRTAYANLLTGLLPRWHGSHDLMYQFGVECMATERYDTDVPYMYCDTLWSIIRDAKHNPLGNRYLKKPGIYDNARTVCQRYIEQEGGETNIPWWKTVWLGFACLTEHWDDGERLLEELDFNLDADALGRFPLSTEEVISAVTIHASPHADAILAAFRDADNGRNQQAVAALTEILANEDLQPIIANRVRSHLQGLQGSLDFQEGSPVNLLPERNLDGWKIVAGDWNPLRKGGVRGVSDTRGVILQCESKFGTHWQLTGKTFHGKSPYNLWDAGIILYVDGRPTFSMMFNPSEKWVAAGPYRELKSHSIPYEPQGKTTNFVIRVEGDTVNMWINEELLIEDQEILGLSDAANARLAIGALYNWAGSTLTYKNLEIKKIEPVE